MMNIGRRRVDSDHRCSSSIQGLKAPTRSPVIEGKWRLLYTSQVRAWLTHADSVIITFIRLHTHRGGDIENHAPSREFCHELPGLTWPCGFHRMARRRLSRRAWWAMTRSRCIRRLT
jgi:hypothetical protein